MNPLDDAQLRNHLSRTAKEAADEHRLSPDPSAQDALGELITRAAEHVDPNDEESVAAAERAFQVLARTVAEAHPEGGGREAAATREIDAARVQAALVKLCPGLLALLLMAEETVPKTKPFDYGQDATKQLITLSTGVVTVTVAFLGGVAADAPADARTVLYVSWGLFGLAIVLGVLTLLNLTGNVGTAADTNSEGINRSSITIFAITQVIVFVLAMAGTIYFGWRSFPSVPSDDCKTTTTKTVTTGKNKVETKVEHKCKADAKS